MSLEARHCSRKEPWVLFTQIQAPARISSSSTMKRSTASRRVVCHTTRVCPSPDRHTRLSVHGSETIKLVHRMSEHDAAPALGRRRRARVKDYWSPASVVPDVPLLAPSALPVSPTTMRLWPLDERRSSP
jgi:hypothetical protein